MTAVKRREDRLRRRRRPGVTVEGVGQVVLQPVNAEDGAPAMIADALVIRAFGTKSEHLAYAQATSFAHPELRSWESLGAGGIVPKALLR